MKSQESGSNLHDQCMKCEVALCPSRGTQMGCPAVVFEDGKPRLLSKAT